MKRYRITLFYTAKPAEVFTVSVRDHQELYATAEALRASCRGAIGASFELIGG